MKPVVIIALCCAALGGAAQTDYAYQTFNGPRIINGYSVETKPQGVATFVISHRFGDIYQDNAGSILYNFFGFDGGANMRIAMDYAPTGFLMAGIGRSSFGKTYDVYLKGKILKQSKGEKHMPVSISGYVDCSVITDTGNAIMDTYFADRLNYAYQLLIARKFNDALSVQISPTLVHRNLVATRDENNDVFAVGISAKWQFAKNVALNGEYYYTFPGQLPDGYANYAGIGFDFITKGHVFQLQITNSPYLTPTYLVGNTIGKIFDKDAAGRFDLNVRFGFNIVRDFKIGGRQY